MCDGIFSDYSIADFLESVSVKELLKLTLIFGKDVEVYDVSLFDLQYS